MELFNLKENGLWIELAKSEMLIYGALELGGRLILVNDQFRKIYQCNPLTDDHVLFQDLFLLEEQQRIEQEFKLLELNPQKGLNHVLTSKLEDGQLFSVHWEFRMYRNANTLKPVISAIGYPLSRNKAVKFALSGVAHHFEIIFEKNPDILVVMDRNYNIVRLNPSAKNFFSKGNVDVPTKGMNLMSLKNRYNIDLMILLNSLSEIKESFSQTQALQINEEFYTVYFASSDQFISFLMKDVTESKLNLRKLKDAQLNLRQLLDNSLDTVIYFNANLVVTYFNYEAAKNFQTMDGELLSEGVDIRSFLPEEFKFLMSEFDEIVQKGKRISKDVFIVNRWLRVNVYPIKDQELGNFQFALTASDVTNIKEMQRQLEIQNESLKKINWRHSHELRAPLSNILGLIQLLEGSSHIEKADFDALLDGLKRSSEQLDVVIHEIVNETYSSIG